MSPNSVGAGLTRYKIGFKEGERGQPAFRNRTICLFLQKEVTSLLSSLKERKEREGRGTALLRSLRIIAIAQGPLDRKTELSCPGMARG